MADFPITITGAREIERALKELPRRMATKVIRQALRASIRPMASSAKDNAPRGETGQLKKAIKVRAGKRKKGVIAIRLGVDAKDFKAPGEPAAVEYGRDGQAAEPYLRPAFDANGESAKEEALRLIRDGVEREVKALKAN